MERESRIICEYYKNGFCRQPGITPEAHPLMAEKITISKPDKATGKVVTTFACRAIGIIESMDQRMTAQTECIKSFEQAVQEVEGALEPALSR